MVWVYDRTNSLSLAMLMHASLTSSLLILGPTGTTGGRLLLYDAMVGGVLWIFVGALKLSLPTLSEGSAGTRPPRTILAGR